MSFCKDKIFSFAIKAATVRERLIKEFRRASGETNGLMNVSLSLRE
jgi:hypothetical protein